MSTIDDQPGRCPECGQAMEDIDSTNEKPVFILDNQQEYSDHVTLFVEVAPETWPNFIGLVAAFGWKIVAVIESGSWHVSPQQNPAAVFNTYTWLTTETWPLAIQRLAKIASPEEAAAIFKYLSEESGLRFEPEGEDLEPLRAKLR